jgi:hypothetical protein
MYHLIAAMVTAAVGQPKATNSFWQNLLQWLQNNLAVIVAIIVSLITATASIIAVRITAIYNRITLNELQRNQHAHEVNIQEVRTSDEIRALKNRQIIARYIRYQEAIWKDGPVSQTIGERLSIDTEYVPVKILRVSQSNTGAVTTPAAQKARIFDPSLLMRTTQMQREKSIRDGEAIDLLRDVVLQPDKDKQKKHYIVQGEIGVGKTLALRYIAYEVCKHENMVGTPNPVISDQQPLPIYIMLKDFATSQCENLFDYIVDDWYNHIKDDESLTLSDIKNLLRTKLEKGSVILLLDGFDETFIGSDDKARKASSDRVCNAIDIIANPRHSQNFIIITTRNDIQHAKLQNFMKYRISDFCLDTICDFVVKWLKSHNEGDFLEHLWGMLRCNPRLQSLGTRQLLLWSTANQYRKAQSRDERDLASSYQLAVLCDKSIKLLLNDWNSEKTLVATQKNRVLLSGIALLWKRLTRRSDQPLPVYYNKSSETTKLRLLEDIAWKAHTTDEYRMSEKEALKIVQACVPAPFLTKLTKRLSYWAQKKPDLFKPIISRNLALQKQEEASHKQILQEISYHSGLLQERNEAGSVSYNFPSLLFQEFFAARYAKRVQNTATLLKNYNHPWWKQVIIFYVHMLDATAAKSFLNTLLTLTQSDDFHTHLLLAGCCLAARRDTENYPELYGTIIQQLVEELLNTTCSLVQQQIVFVLNEIEKDSVRLLQDLRTFIQSTPVSPTPPIPNTLPVQSATSTPAIPAPRTSSCSTLFSKLSNPLPSIPYSFLPLITDLPYKDFLEDINNDTNTPLLDAIPKKDRRAFYFRSLLNATNRDNNNRIRIINALASQAEPAVATALFALLTQNLTTPNPNSPALIDLSCHIAHALKAYGDSSQDTINQILIWIEDINLDIHIRCSLIKTLHTWNDLFYAQITPALLNIFAKDTLDDYLRWSLAIALVAISNIIPYNPSLRGNAGWSKFLDPTLKRWNEKLQQQRGIDIPWLNNEIATVAPEQQRYVIDTLAVLLTDEQFINDLAQNPQWQHLSDDLYIARRIVWERNKCRERTL